MYWVVLPLLTFHLPFSKNQQLCRGRNCAMLEYNYFAISFTMQNVPEQHIYYSKSKVIRCWKKMWAGVLTHHSCSCAKRQSTCPNFAYLEILVQFWFFLSRVSSILLNPNKGHGAVNEGGGSLAIHHIAQRHSHSHLQATLESPINLKRMFLDYRYKAEYQLNAHPHTYEVLIKSLGSNWGSSHDERKLATAP